MLASAPANNLAITISGPHDLRSRLERDKAFDASIRMLLGIFLESLPPERKRLSRSFTVVATGIVKGSAHSKGLHMQTPSGSGARFTWHQGSNDNNVQFLVPTPTVLVRDRMEFHDLLTKAFDEAARQMKDKKANGNGNGKHVEKGEKKPDSAGADSAKHEEGAADVPPQDAPKVFTLDEDTIELVLIACFDIGNQAGDPIVPRRDVIKALERCGCDVLVRSSSFKKLIEDGHLEEILDRPDFLRFGKSWRVKLCNEPEEEAPAAPPPEPEQGDGVGLGRGPGGAYRKAMSRVPTLKRLIASAERAAELRAELEKAHKKRAPLQARIEALNAEIARLDAELATLAEDERLLVELEQRIGSS